MIHLQTSLLKRALGSKPPLMRASLPHSFRPPKTLSVTIRASCHNRAPPPLALLQRGTPCQPITWRAVVQGQAKRRWQSTFSRRFGGRGVDGETVVWGILGANVLVYGLWVVSLDSRRRFSMMVEHFTVSPYGILRDFKLHTLITNMFSHKDFSHLLVNMITLYFFGMEAAMLLGAKRFLQLYFGSGVLSALCCVSWPYVAPSLPIPASYRVSKYTNSMGASGAVNGLVAYSILMFPRRMVYIYMVLPVPAAMLGVLFLAKDLSGLYLGGGMEANAGHLGGALFGAAFFAMSRGRGRYY